MATPKPPDSKGKSILSPDVRSASDEACRTSGTVCV